MSRAVFETVEFSRGWSQLQERPAKTFPANVDTIKRIPVLPMSSKVYSAAVVGVETFEVEVEGHAGWGNPDKIVVVGLPDTAVKEAKIELPPPFATADRAGRTARESPSIWRRPMSARKGPALICRSPWRC